MTYNAIKLTRVKYSPYVGQIGTPKSKVSVADLPIPAGTGLHLLSNSSWDRGCLDW